MTLRPGESLPLNVLRGEDSSIHRVVVFLQSHEPLGRDLAHVGEDAPALEGGAAAARLLLGDAMVQVKSNMDLVILAHL